MVFVVNLIGMEKRWQTGLSFPEGGERKTNEEEGKTIICEGDQSRWDFAFRCAHRSLGRTKESGKTLIIASKRIIF